MKQLLNAIFLIFFWSNFTPIYAQQGNPFDVIRRANNVATPIIEKAKDTSIIAVIPSVETNLETTQAIIPLQDSSVVESSEIEIPKPTTKSTDEPISYLDQIQKKLMDENPFNITHIPLKKSKKEIKPELNKGENSSSEIIKPEKIEAQPEEKEAISIPETINNLKTNKFIFWLLLLQLLLVTSILSFNRDFIRKLYRSISNDNFAKLVGRDYNNGYNALFGILYFLFILSFSVFVYQFLKLYYGIHGFGKYFVILLSVASVYSVRHIFQGITSVVFPFGKTSSYYNFMIILFNSFLGLLLIPTNVIIAYAPANIAVSGIYIGCFLIIAFYLMRFLRGSLHAYTYIRNYTFHFFLYLCSCEFAPVFILVKFLSRSFIT